MLHFRASKLAVLAAVSLLGVATSSATTSNYTFTTIDVPGAAYGTDPYAINNGGEIVGQFGDATGVAQGFSYQNGTFNLSDFPSQTLPTSINNSGQSIEVLSYLAGNGVALNTNGTLSTINVPGALYTDPYAINDAGQIVGTFQIVVKGVQQYNGFLDTNGVFTTIDVPGALVTEASGINNAGAIVGTFNDSSNTPGGDTQGFLDVNGVFTTIDIPGAVRVDPLSINDAGQIVGLFEDSQGHDQGFLDVNGAFTIINVPGSIYTTLTGINDAGQIVGFDIGPVTTQGFLATPGPNDPTSVPESSTWAMMLLGFAGLGYAAFRRAGKARGNRLPPMASSPD